MFEEPQVHARRMQIELDHPLAGKVPGVASPLKFSQTPPHYQKAPPLLGEDTEDVLTRLLGKSEANIEDLRKRGIL